MGAVPRVFVVTGEPSGDQHAAMLGAELLQRAKVELVGVGQRAMRAAGFQLLYDSTDWSGIGVCQSLMRYPKLAARAQHPRLGGPAPARAAHSGGFRRL